ncbi:hypothetical protein QBC38DRAFT_55349 [Podospora fimiseda]|uniref:F-box domain-containing protein n=1 Tax=Podospora fimiseda TaxID=252190 RepID=A0AAN7H3P6_9PEZI|nr:hypothetical protein QBC38DRAFT_55349 [Podospora fimiseda]
MTLAKMGDAENEQPKNLTDLPAEILLLISANFETARDLRALALSCHTFHRLIRDDGWKLFVKASFPSLSIPNPALGRHTWQQLAESLTWQSRCWDRRALQFHALLSSKTVPTNDRDTRQFHRRNQRLFQAIVDAHFDPSTQEELVVWGAGEDIVARHRERVSKDQGSKSSWHRINGKDLGFQVGHDDVNAVKIIKHQTGRKILSGRHNGKLSLVSAEPQSFGELLSEFILTTTPEAQSNGKPQQQEETVNSLDVLQNGTSTLIAAATKTSVVIYDLPEELTSKITPLTVYDLQEDVFTSETSRLSRAKWMEQGETMALALSGTANPLRYLAVTPTGWTHHTAAKNLDIAAKFELKDSGNLCPNSLEPVYRNGQTTGRTSLILSSWRDGTVRLQDLRTSSPFDAVYQDNIDPWADAEALMSYGAERFITGGGDGLTVKVFDFRWTKAYYHTSGLSCQSCLPFPPPSQSFIKQPTQYIRGRAKCDYLRQSLCHWHEFSKSIYFRPNAKYFLSNSLSTLRGRSIWSFVRGSDISPNFYVGISGGVLEANLEPCPNFYPPEIGTIDPNFGFPDWRSRAPEHSGYSSRAAPPMLMEIGDGLSYTGNDQPIRLPRMLECAGPRSFSLGMLEASQHHRLDINYQNHWDMALMATQSIAEWLKHRERIRP